MGSNVRCGRHKSEVRSVGSKLLGSGGSSDDAVDSERVSEDFCCVLGRLNVVGAGRYYGEVGVVVRCVGAGRSVLERTKRRGWTQVCETESVTFGNCCSWKVQDVSDNAILRCVRGMLLY